MSREPDERRNRNTGDTHSLLLLIVQIALASLVGPVRYVRLYFVLRPERKCSGTNRALGGEWRRLGVATDHGDGGFGTEWNEAQTYRGEID